MKDKISLEIVPTCSEIVLGIIDAFMENEQFFSSTIFKACLYEALEVYNDKLDSNEPINSIRNYFKTVAMGKLNNFREMK